MRIFLAHFGHGFHGFGGIGFLLVAIVFTMLLLAIWPSDKTKDDKK
ncbi:hypothetical protein SBV1_890030 [Verrucomicrobia bacterium]|nr:hypothetical protein SBV1_890030 [Verrucomicrobiota bacterium]